MPRFARSQALREVMNEKGPERFVRVLRRVDRLECDGTAARRKWPK